MLKKILALGAVVTMGAAVFAAAPARSDSRPSSGMQSALGLSDEQWAQLKTLRSEHAKQRIRARADLRVARLELRDLLASPTVDEKAVRAKERQLEQIQSAAVRDRVEHTLALRRILSAEQMEKLMQMRRHRMGGHGGFFRRWRDRRADDVAPEVGPGGGRGDDSGEADGVL